MHLGDHCTIWDQIFLIHAVWVNAGSEKIVEEDSQAR